MRDIVTVSKFTLKEMIKRKVFIITTIIIMALIVLGFNLPNIINIFSKGSISEGSKILIADNENIFEGKLKEIDGKEMGYSLKIKTSSLDEIKKDIESHKVNAGIIVERENNEITFRYIVNDTMAMMPEDLGEQLEKLYTNIQIEKLGLSETEIKQITPTFDVQVEQTETIKGNTLVITLLSILLFYAIYFCAYQVSSSITTEKTSKIMETLVTSTSPRTIVIGKTIGIGLGGLIQILILILTAVVSAKLFLSKAMLDLVLTSTQVSPLNLTLMIIFFILGYYLFAFIYALSGSTVSKPEDIQAAATPVTLLTIAGFYLSEMVINKPVGSLTNFATICPISSPFAMPARVMMGLSSPSEIILSLAVLIVSIIVVAHVAIKIYSNAILNYGTKMTIKDLVKMYKAK